MGLFLQDFIHFTNLTQGSRYICLSSVRRVTGHEIITTPPLYKPTLRKTDNPQALEQFSQVKFLWTHYTLAKTVVKTQLFLNIRRSINLSIAVWQITPKLSNLKQQACIISQFPWFGNPGGSFLVGFGPESPMRVSPAVARAVVITSKHWRLISRLTHMVIGNLPLLTSRWPDTPISYNLSLSVGCLSALRTWQSASLGASDLSERESEAVT